MKKLAFLLIPIFGLFFTSNSFALKHDYNGINTGALIRPPLVQGENGRYFYDFNSTNYVSDYNSLDSSSPLYVYVPTEHGERYGSYKQHWHLNYWSFPSNGQFAYNSNSDSCLVNSWSPNFGQQFKYYLRWDFRKYSGNNNALTHDGPFAVAGAFDGFIIDTRPFFVNGYNPISTSDNSLGSIRCFNRSYFEQSKFSYNTSGTTYWDLVGQNSDNTFSMFAPDGFSLNNIANSDGLALSDVQTNSDGVQYDSRFSFSRLFTNTDVPYVRGLRIPLSSIDGYFLKSENLYEGRDFEFNFTFNFPSGLELNSNLEGSYFYLRLENAFDVSGNHVTLDSDINFNTCHTETLNFEGATQLKLICTLTLNKSYAGFDPYFIIDIGRDDYLFHTTGEWSFGMSYLVTDNNYQSGDSLNDGLSGMWSLYDGSDYIQDDADFFSSFKNLFNFNVPSQPLGLALGGFTNQDSCASIPIIAGMIHSNETQVCPWFSAETRSITTPVLTLFSGFLVFGFIIHWLGSSSGNFLEDSGTHGDGSIKVGKRGKE